MSSPLQKTSGDNGVAQKQRKIKSTNTAKSSTNLDTRSELADLVKRKAEISVSQWKFICTNIPQNSIQKFYFIGNIGKSRKTDLCI